MEGDGVPSGGEMEVPWMCFPFPARTTTIAGAVVGYRYEQLSCG